ncbi:MAG: 30S ribosomal protein S8e [Methanocellales archaeon]|nr:30S ribosomal protein S8e [Methanocellales archaeon]MDD3291892.1 30S ribosomal protein S8e [Methanocellales archaeon]MDD5235797.1 30S ribosomal protein S8e [Methanocellales archaeon]MDD5485554.1 30S ribosomal protein S8e [Methanocellales archaeon]
MKWQGKSRRKATGGRLRSTRSKRKHEMGRDSVEAHIGPIKRLKLRVMGGGEKISLHRGDVANVTDPKTGKTQVVEIQTVDANPANQHYVRRNILMKGAVIRTKLGKAKINNRPGQDGIVNAVLIE